MARCEKMPEGQSSTTGRPREGSTSVPLSRRRPQDQMCSDTLIMGKQTGGVRADWSAGDARGDWREIQVVKSTEPRDGWHEASRRGGGWTG